MKLLYYPETDSLYIDLNHRTSIDSREVADGVVVDLDGEGDIVSIDIGQASSRLDLTTVETENLPLVSAGAA